MGQGWGWVWEIPVLWAQFAVNLKVLIKIKSIEIFKRLQRWGSGRKGEKLKTIGRDYLTMNQLLGESIFGIIF